VDLAVVVSLFIAMVSILVTIHYKKLADKDAELTNILSVIDEIKTRLNTMQTHLVSSDRDIVSLYKTTSRLENSLEKEVVQISNKLDKLHDMIFDLVKDRQQGKTK
jgi:hypothetical protein